MAQYTGAHNHMRCVGTDYMLVSWLCAPCIAIPVYITCHIIGKRMLSNRTENHLGSIGLAAMSDKVNVRFIALHIKYDGTQGPVHG